MFVHHFLENLYKTNLILERKLSKTDTCVIFTVISSEQENITCIFKFPISRTCVRNQN